MASNFVPMLSSSPPPLEDCPDDDDDDDFGNFTSANIAFDSSFDSPVANSKHKPYLSNDKGVNDDRLNQDFNTFSSVKDTTLQNHIGSPPIETNNVNQNEPEKVREHYFEDSLNNYAKCEGSSTLNSVSHDKITLDSFSSSIDSLEEAEPTICSFIKDPKSNSDVSSSKENLDCVVSDSPEPIPAENNHFCNSVLEHESVNVTPCGLFNTDFTGENMKSININNSFDIDSTEENVCDYLKSEFPVNFETSVDDFHDFKQATPELNHLDETENNPVSKQNSNQSESEQQFNIDFSDSKKNSPEESDEFDDFQSFDKTENNFVVNNVFNESEKTSNYVNCELENSDHVAESEDYDEFQWCSSSVENFANFEAGSLNEKASSDSPEFANFESASFSSISDETSTTQDKNVDKITTVLNAIFPLVSETCDDYCDQPLEILEQSNKSHRLWEKLHEVEQAPGLRFQWGVSHSFQQLLRSVNVDYHSILRTSSFPIFASSLSLLEPVKGQTNTVNAESEDRNQNPRVNDPIPPVEFDWTSSGLVNPLDSGQIASVLMDLSFLATADTATSTSKNDYSFENELLKPSPIPVSCENENRTLILEELLSKNVCSFPNTTTAHRPTNLSEEAKSVLDQLSDLSFMRATVLMFPISSKT